MNISRTIFKKEIICEFIPPAKTSRKVIVLATGMPGYPGRREELLKFISEKGYWVFLPRYRGTWESKGRFLKNSPHKDIIDVVESLEKGFKDLWTGKNYKITRPEVYIVGVSFGGPASLLASSHKLIKKIVALSPVIDWNMESEAEPFDDMVRFVGEGFSDAYRYDKKDFYKLRQGGFYNPMDFVDKLPGEKILIIHAKDDVVVPIDPTYEFVARCECDFVELKTGGHLSTSLVSSPALWRRIHGFFSH